ncbi:MotA/TolQ/ExbB proton channel family protein [Rubellicoccus peritrichatus]|uniref:MotA/TolQ/ExbB proton channel family protein n=1 Tax=Rubellicoccus peritrichatus TaxID=3080537 RepID=A0AAQ3LD76_9BACT|nr:MotA/TolQ/ExbB proton channel family protein [Puniceicoccus sp. CR14]WOO43626.1 MotA/TolQ/ExbB proton channel family protein [Puniceicoccus sp. CR14]
MKKNKLVKFFIFSGVALLFIAVAPLSAQTPSTDGAELAELTPPADEKTILDMVRAGGLAMIPLGMLSVAAVGFIAFNFYAIRRSSFINDSVIEELDEAVSKMDIDKARDICVTNPSPVTNTFNCGLSQIRGDKLFPVAIEKAFENASSKELTGAFVVVNYLSIIAALAPMVGLLGTVSGMVKAFNSIAAEGMGKPEILADNISEALITTASGMAIAIPAMFFFFFFRNRYSKIVAEVNLVLGRLYSDLLSTAEL